MDGVKRAHPEASADAWAGAEDEHRLGLLPVVRRVWAPRGRRPSAPVRRRCEGLYAYGFVRPATGQGWWCLPPTVSLEAMGRALAELARDEGSGPARRAVPAPDRAGWHAGPHLAAPEGVRLAFLPPASPERQPAERRWGLVDEPVANRAFAGLAELEGALVARCRQLAGQRRRIKARTRYHWWPRERRATKPE